MLAQRLTHWPHIKPTSGSEVILPACPYHQGTLGSALADLLYTSARILVQVTIYRRLRIGRYSHLDQSEAYDITLAWSRIRAQAT